MWVKRTSWSALLIAVLLLGALDWHPAGDLHDASAPGRSEVYFPGAEHPTQPAHFEQADPAHRQACPVCALRAQTSGAHLRPLAVMAPPLPELQPAGDLTCPLVSVALRSSGARGPPFIS
jgi:hypothetical protein